ncbi:MAG TPA: hypothetical protein VMB50_10530, partial [Myxococcales bacterium]|nr:hypothetical protein [Myxococcales bacterium]
DLALVPLGGTPEAAAPPAAPLAAAPATPVAPPAPAAQAVAPPPPKPAEASLAVSAPKPWKPIVLTTAGAVAVAAAGFSAYWGGWGLDALSTSQHNQRLAQPQAAAVYDKEISTYQMQAGVWLSVAAVLAAGGIYLLVVGPASGGAPVAVSAAPLAGGGVLGFSGAFR